MLASALWLGDLEIISESPEDAEVLADFIYGVSWHSTCPGMLAVPLVVQGFVPPPTVPAFPPSGWAALVHHWALSVSIQCWAAHWCTPPIVVALLGGWKICVAITQCPCVATT